MTQLMKAFWADDAGFIITAELVLVATIVVLGLLAALIAVRDSVGGELTDVANAMRSLDQSYYYGGMGARKSNSLRGFKSWTAGSSYCVQQRGPAVIERPIVRESELACPPEQPIIRPAPCATGDCLPAPVYPAPAPSIAPCGPGNPCGPVVPAAPCDGCTPGQPVPHALPAPQPLVW